MYYAMFVVYMKEVMMHHEEEIKTFHISLAGQKSCMLVVCK
jgi:hypothetical protein